MRTVASAAWPARGHEPLAPAVPHRTLRSPLREDDPRGSDEASLQDFIDIVGGSGRPYRFSRLRAGHPLSPTGGTYVLARHRAGIFEMVYIGAAESLLREAERLWGRERRLFCADQLFSRLNVSGRTRECELADILAGQRPPMNVAEPLAG
jgi:hypothetical protein